MSGALRLRWAAVCDMLARYARVGRAAWQARAAHEGPPPLPHETEFMPAALALQETPVSPAPRVALWLMMAAAGCAVLWAWLGHMDIVAMATGKVVSTDRSKTIQALETASVQTIFVRDGQAVRAGDPLLDLDATQTDADLERLQSAWAAAQWQVARAGAMLRALDQGVLPELPLPSGVPASQLASARAVLAGTWGEYQTKQARLQAEVAAKIAEQSSVQHLVAKLEQTLPITSQRAQDFKTLVEQNFVSKHGYLEREQARIEQVAELASLRSRTAEIHASLQERRAQAQALAAETRRINLDSLNEGQQKIEALEQELRKAERRTTRMRLTAPVAGTVQQLAVHTVGGVVTPAQALMVIAPDEHAIEVEAFLENKDIGFVHSGQAAEVKVEAFPYTRYGTLPASVTSISQDAIQDERRGLIYSMRVQLERDHLDVAGTAVRLTPGMVVNVEIKTGQRRILDYFLAPLLQHQRESLRER